MSAVPTLQQRVPVPRAAWTLEQAGVSPLLARLFASRGVRAADELDDALARLKPNRRTAIVTLTHDPKIDDPALLHAFQRGCFYIGALGSRKTHAKRGQFGR